MTGAWSTPPVTYAVNTLPPFQSNSGSTNLQFTTNGFQFQIFGLNGTGQVVIYASTNFSNWDAIFTNANPPIGTMLIMDPSSTNLPWRFYKAKGQ